MVVSMVGTLSRISATPLGCGSRAKLAIKKLDFVGAGQTGWQEAESSRVQARAEDAAVEVPSEARPLRVTVSSNSPTLRASTESRPQAHRSLAWSAKPDEPSDY